MRSTIYLSSSKDKYPSPYLSLKKDCYWFTCVLILAYLQWHSASMSITLTINIKESSHERNQINLTSNHINLQHD